jgi:catechol 2,3-dioxygenase-like lactoylglutathione lyase family enzyme
MVSIGSVVMQVSDVRRAAEFWIKALGYVPRDGHIDEDSVILEQKGGRGPALALDRSDRMHLDLYTDSEEEQRAEVERLESLGARRVEWTYPDDADFVVLADPEGNLFCVVNTTLAG